MTTAKWKHMDDDSWSSETFTLCVNEFGEKPIRLMGHDVDEWMSIDEAKAFAAKIIELVGKLEKADDA
jgi:hypothetical protein